MRKQIIVTALGAALMAAPLAGAQSLSAESGSRTPTPASYVGTAMARQDIRAQLMPRRYTTLAAEIGAKIDTISVSEGGAFRAGQVLVQFDCSIQQAQLAKTLAELEGANRTYKANQRLEQLNSVGQLELDLSASAVSKAKAEVGITKAVLDKCQIRAPFSGRVAEQKVRAKQFVQPAQALLDILDDSVLELEFLVPSTWMRWIKIGGQFDVQIDETRKTYPANFTRIGARVDPVSQSLKVAAAIHGHFPELVTGMSGKVLLTPPPGQ